MPKRNASRRKTKKAMKKTMAKRIASYNEAIRSGRMVGALIPTKRRKRNPVRVPASMSGKSTGWIKAKGVRVRKSGRGFVVDVKR